ncbi:saccharopine dehydrogenase NADP-binding domain-containing protein [Mammaliicoccus sciuri]|uniref:saccharopine dehydrogenase NADP-binding domain-containing protein n=1 Tax=Mammaliicoccus sciuri TaxID=1296 RepID=UPI001FB439FB|nr:saccharopine dehydrogenase NADP-binding domain-containing protein [Mammaliicoccus sciuri]MCJ1781135.1 saccharopine dehydrogenase NADP-binding domain-containing protein [Mammaliicoccus sciuri]
MSKVMIFGLGEVGTHILHFLVRDPKCPELVFCDFNKEISEKKINNALIGAAITRNYPKITFEQADLTDINHTAKLISEYKPDVVINCAVLQTWHVIRQLPEKEYQRISSATLGAWLPCQFSLAYHLMLGIEQSGQKPHVINTALSCLTNPVLAKVGLAPTIGIGNVELIESAVRLNISRKLGVSMDIVKVYLIAHHLWWVYPREAGYEKGPYYLKILVNDVEVTDQFDTDELLYDSIKLYPPGTEFTTTSAISTIKNMYALLSPTPIFTHSPSPKGLPGGYPILLSNKGAELALPEGITELEAIKINEESSKMDGIERIEDDGTVIFADYAHEILKDMIGFDRKSFKPEESHEVALEMMNKYKQYFNRMKKEGKLE